MSYISKDSTLLLTSVKRIVLQKIDSRNWHNSNFSPFTAVFFLSLFLHLISKTYLLFKTVKLQKLDSRNQKYAQVSFYTHILYGKEFGWDLCVLYIVKPEDISVTFLRHQFFCQWHFSFPVISYLKDICTKNIRKYTNKITENLNSERNKDLQFE